MITTPAQQLQTSLLLYRIAKKHGSGEGVGGLIPGCFSLRLYKDTHMFFKDRFLADTD